MSDEIETELASSRDGYLSRLRLLIDDLGGMKAFSEKVDIPYQSVRQYLRNSEPTRPVLLKIASKLGISLDWLLQGEEQTGSDVVFVSGGESSYMRLEVSRRLEGDSAAAELSNRTNIPIRRLNLLREAAEPTLTEAIRLCEALGMNTYPSGPDPRLSDFILLPRVNAAAVNEFMQNDLDFRYAQKAFFSDNSGVLEGGEIAIARSELRSRFAGDFKTLATFRVQDNKLQPKLSKGALVLIDLVDTQLEEDELFLCRFGGKINMRIADKDRDDSWFLRRSIDQNATSYSDEQLSLLNPVLGRQIGVLDF